MVLWGSYDVVEPILRCCGASARLVTPGPRDCTCGSLETGGLQQGAEMLREILGQDCTCPHITLGSPCPHLRLASICPHLRLASPCSHIKLELPFPHLTLATSCHHLTLTSPCCVLTLHWQMEDFGDVTFNWKNFPKFSKAFSEMSFLHGY